MPMELIILAGMPATGKSTIATALCKAFGFPILEKDDIKEALFDTIGFENYPQKRQLDVAACAVQLRVLESMLKAGNSLILVNNFDGESAQRLRRLIERYRPFCVTVFLSGQPKVLYERYIERDRLHQRHLGHILQEHYPPHEGDSLDHIMTPEEFDEKFFKRGMDSFQCPGLRIDLDMTDPKTLDTAELIDRVQVLLNEHTI